MSGSSAPNQLLIRWKKKRGANHWLDSTTLGIIALDSLGCRVIDEPTPKRTEWGKDRVGARPIRVAPRRMW